MMADLTPEQQQIMDFQAADHPFNKFTDLVGYCSVCSRPMRRKDFKVELWRGDPTAVTAYNKEMCAGCHTRGGNPPLYEQSWTVPVGRKPVEKIVPKPVQDPRSGGFQMPLLGSIKVSRAESAAVIASADRRVGRDGAIEIAEILGIRP